MLARLSRSISTDVSQLLSRYTGYHQSLLTIEQFTNFGKNASISESYKFLRHEVPVRLAHIMQEMHHLPPNLKKIPSVKLVHRWYAQSFADLVGFQDMDENSPADVEQFTQTLYQIKRRHDNVVETMAQGIMQLRENEGDKAFAPLVQSFLDNFFMSRVGIRLLITQHLALHEESRARGTKTGYIGMFDPNLNVRKVVTDASANAGMLCTHYYYDSPDVLIRERNEVKPGGDIDFSYVPSHLYHILFELMKNAMRATEEKHRLSSDKPKVEVDIVRGSEDLTIRIADCGGGIPRSQMDKLFQYHFTTAPQPELTGGMGVLAGYGYGLPLSRVYAKYFGGDLQITSMEGFGTHAYIYLKALSTHAKEAEPRYTNSSDSFLEEVTEEDELHAYERQLQIAA